MIADVSYSFGTRDRSWETLVVIDLLSGSVEEPQIAFNSSGRAAAVWLQDDGSYNGVYSSMYTVENGWSDVEVVDMLDYDALYPQIAVGSSDNATAVWYIYNGTAENHYKVYANRYTAGGSWGDAVLLDSDISDYPEPEVAADPWGNMTAVWANGNDICAANYR